MSPQTAQTVLIIGCGVSGPVMALMLQKKGYHPIVFEKVTLGDAGGSLMLMPNGLKVLDLVDIAAKVTKDTPNLQELRDQTHLGETLGSNDLFKRAIENYSQPGCGVKRTTLSLLLRDTLAAHAIPLHQGWKLVDIEEKDSSVIAVFENGQRVEGSFLIGCDGIKSATRTLLFEKKGIKQGDANFTGLSQVGGFSPTPPELQDRPALLNIFGPGSHFITFPMGPGTSGWAITQRETEKAKESWRQCSPSELADQKAALLKHWGSWVRPVPELIRTSHTILKFGLYDRPELDPEHWHHNRCVLIGDAAHPTSPHLGQGANQALEDCYHLSTAIPEHAPTSDPISSSLLTQIFSAFASKRQPRTAALVKGARAQGEMRVVQGGPAAVAERDEKIRWIWGDRDAVEAKYDSLLREPFVKLGVETAGSVSA